jgi:hypothetical protein
MKTTLLNKTIAVLAVAAFSLTACKTSSDVAAYIQHIKLSKDAQTFEYSTTFSKNVEVDIEAEFPIGRYGTVAFYKDDAGLFHVGLRASFSLFGDINLTPVSKLPTGMSFPAIVSGPLYQYVVKSVPGKYAVYAYFDNLTTSGAKKLAGVAIQFQNIKNNLPQVTITQSFFTNDNKKFASFTVFGPTTIDGKEVPGGIFLVGDINQAIDSGNFLTNSTTIGGKDAAKYKTDKEKQQLMRKVQKVFEVNGVKLH